VKPFVLARRALGSGLAEWHRASGTAFHVKPQRANQLRSGSRVLARHQGRPPTPRRTGRDASAPSEAADAVCTPGIRALHPSRPTRTRARSPPSRTNRECSAPRAPLRRGLAFAFAPAQSIRFRRPDLSREGGYERERVAASSGVVSVDEVGLEEASVGLIPGRSLGRSESI
jgi:hypothetical protein